MGRYRLAGVGLSGLAVWALAGCRTTPSEADSGLAAAGGVPGRCPAEVLTLQTSRLDADIQRAFTVCLAEYITINTTNGLKNEAKAVDWLTAVFAAAGIEAERFETPDLDRSGDQRAYLLATLPGSDPQARPVILMHHMDVVSADRTQWRPLPDDADPVFGGRTLTMDGEQVVLGRGAIDMKNIGVMHLLSMVLAKHEATPLRPAVHFLAVADEENLASGAVGAVKAMVDDPRLAPLARARLVLNEGGSGVRDAVPGKRLLLVGTEERGGAWLRLETHDPGQFFQAMAALQLISPYPLPSFAKNSWRCRLQRLASGDGEINVVPSKVEVELSCGQKPAGLARYFEAATATQALLRHFRLRGPPETYKVAVDDAAWQKAGDTVMVRLESSSTAHGSSGTGVDLLMVTGFGLQALGAVELLKPVPPPAPFRYQLTPATREMLRTVGADVAGAAGPGFEERVPAALDRMRRFGLIGPRLHSVESLFRTTCNWTGVRALRADASSFVSGEADSAGYPRGMTATLDCRLIDLESGDHAARFLAALDALMKKLGLADVKLTLANGWNHTASDAGGTEFAVVKRALAGLDPDAVVTPVLIPGGTDSTFLRDPSNADRAWRRAFGKGIPGIEGLKGVTAFGLTPAMLTVPILSTFHGSDERFPVAQGVPAVRAMGRILKGLSDEAGGAL